MKFSIIILIVIGIVVSGIVFYFEFSNPSTSGVLELSVTAGTTPYGVKIHTPEELASLEEQTIQLDNSTLEKIPVLENAINQAFGKYTPPPFNDSQTYITQISQKDSDSIINLAGSKAYQLPDTQTSDTYMGGNLTTYSTAMDFKFNNFFYHVVIDQTSLTPDQPVNTP